MFGWLNKKLAQRRARIQGEAFARIATALTRHATRDFETEWRRIGVEGKYDAAQTNSENRRHWQNADGLSANAANDPATRRLLRNRTRYECANNPHAKNLLISLANYTIGTGPRLQVVTENEDVNRAIEYEFARWALAVDLAAKLRTMRMAKCEDGEAFAQLVNREKEGTPVTLDLRLLEAEQIASANPAGNDANNIDGIILDKFGIPFKFEVLDRHPGDKASGSATSKVIPAAYMLQYMRQDRPGQVRGIPELTPALPLFAMLRRYVLAVLSAAESAASFAAVLKTIAPPMGDDEGNGQGNAASIPPGFNIEIERNMLTSLPEGWGLEQLKAEQPTAQFGDFFDKILGGIGCVMSVPFNVVACNSSGYNYASGRLDYQSFDLSLKVERESIEQQILDRVFKEWFLEASAISGYLPTQARNLDVAFNHQWFWDGREHVDPVKEANAQKIRLANGTTNLAMEWAKIGRDYATEINQWAGDKSAMLQALIDKGFTRTEAMAIAFNNAAPQTVEVVTPDGEQE